MQWLGAEAHGVLRDGQMGTQTPRDQASPQANLQVGGGRGMGRGRRRSALLGWGRRPPFPPSPAGEDPLPRRQRTEAILPAAPHARQPGGGCDLPTPRGWAPNPPLRARLTAWTRPPRRGWLCSRGPRGGGWGWGVPRPGQGGPAGRAWGAGFPGGAASRRPALRSRAASARRGGAAGPTWAGSGFRRAGGWCSPSARTDSPASCSLHPDLPGRVYLLTASAGYP